MNRMKFSQVNFNEKFQKNLQLYIIDFIQFSETPIIKKNIKIRYWFEGKGFRFEIHLKLFVIPGTFPKIFFRKSKIWKNQLGINENEKFN